MEAPVALNKVKGAFPWLLREKLFNITPSIIF